MQRFQVGQAAGPAAASQAAPRDNSAETGYVAHSVWRQ